MDYDDSLEHVEFEGEEKVKPSSYSQRIKSYMADWVVRHHLARDTDQANLLLIAFSIFIFALAVLITYFGSLYVNLKQTDLLVPAHVQTKDVIK